jgi:hypothetical protein
MGPLTPGPIVLIIAVPLLELIVVGDMRGGGRAKSVLPFYFTHPVSRAWAYSLSSIFLGLCGPPLYLLPYEKRDNSFYQTFTSIKFRQTLLSRFCPLSIG